MTPFVPSLAQISIEPVFGWFTLVPLAIILVASIWLTLTSPGISWRGRCLLAALRLAAAAVLLLGWMRPGFVSVGERESEGAVAVLMDRSLSMTLPGESGAQNRWEETQAIWQQLVSKTNLEIGASKIVPFFYDSQPVAVDAADLPGLSSSFEKEPDGRSTDLGKALNEIGRLQVEPPLRGVVMMGDAVQTNLPAEIDPTVIARQMAQIDQPIVFLGVGPRGDKSQVRDVAIEALPEHYTAFVKKELSIRFLLSAQGVQSQPIDVQIVLRSGSDRKVLESREVLATRASEKMPLDFKVAVDDEGEYLLEVSANLRDEDSQEQILSNNLALSFITVREGGVKILYLEGEPRFEQLFLKQSLDASLDFDVQFEWFQERSRNTWPIDFSRRVNFRDYDVIVIGDLDASVFNRATWSQIASRVGAGGGVMFLGGYHSFGAGGYGGSPLKDVYPISLGPVRQQFDRPVDERLHVNELQRLQPPRPHPITSFTEEPDNSAIWRRLPELDGLNRINRAAIKKGPATQILLETNDRHPALIAGAYGRGRTLLFAGDSTWKWCLAGQKKIHQQFWRQAVLWLVRRDVLNEGFRMDMDRRRLLIDENPDLDIDWFGGSENKPMPEDVTIELSREGRVLRQLPAIKAGDDKQESKIVGLDEAGLYQAKLKAQGEDGSDYEANIAFIVRDESRELIQPNADYPMMRSIVAANQAAGGMLINANELDQAIEFLKERQRETRVTTTEKRRLGDAAWDAWAFLALFCLLMSVEWALRKNWQLP